MLCYVYDSYCMTLLGVYECIDYTYADGCTGKIVIKGFEYYSVTVSGKLLFAVDGNLYGYDSISEEEGIVTITTSAITFDDDETLQYVSEDTEEDHPKWTDVAFYTLKAIDIAQIPTSIAYATLGRLGGNVIKWRKTHTIEPTGITIDLTGTAGLILDPEYSSVMYWALSVPFETVIDTIEANGYKLIYKTDNTLITWYLDNTELKGNDISCELIKPSSITNRLIVGGDTIIKSKKSSGNQINTASLAFLGYNTKDKETSALATIKKYSTVGERRNYIYTDATLKAATYDELYAQADIILDGIVDERTIQYQFELLTEQKLIAGQNVIFTDNGMEFTLQVTNVRKSMNEKYYSVTCGGYKTKVSEKLGKTFKNGILYI